MHGVCVWSVVNGDLQNGMYHYSDVVVDDGMQIGTNGRVPKLA